MNRTYKSNIGTWTTVLLILGLGIGFGIIVYYIFKFPNSAWFGLLIIGSIMGYLIYLYNNTKYKFTEDNKLDIRAGFKRISIDLKSINSVCDITSFNTIPNVYALSEQRIKIKYGQGNSLEISPRSKEQFIQEMKRINSSIIRYKDVNSATNKS